MGSICSLKRATSVLASGQTDSSSSTSVWQKVQRNVPAGEKQSLQTCLQGAAWTEPAEKFRPQLLYIPADISQEVNLLVAIGAICALILVIYNQSGSGLVFMEAGCGCVDTTGIRALTETLALNRKRLRGKLYAVRTTLASYH